MEFINTTLEELKEGQDKIGKREDVIIEKGVVLTEDYLEQNQDLFSKYAQMFSAYPDIFLDTISSESDSFSLFYYQRIILRALMRYKEVYVCACRATSKSFLSILALYLQCIFMPGTKRFIVATYKRQAAKVAKEKIMEIYQHWPLLRREIIGGDISDTPGNFGTDYVRRLTYAPVMG